MKSSKIAQACVEQRLLHKGNNILNRIDRLCRLNQLKQLATFHCNHMFQSEVGDSLKAVKQKAICLVRELCFCTVFTFL